MVTMVNQRMVESLSCMLLAKEEFQATALRQARYSGGGGTLDDMQAQMDSELARENALLRRQLLETSADNDAISKSLQERAQSLVDMTDTKIRAETEAKVLQVQLKSMQQDLDAHKYDLHLLRKQLQIRNQEKEQHKRSSDASYKQHLDNVKKIARLESECERLRSLVRQKLPGPTAIAQMRAECEIHVKMGIRKTSLSPVFSSTSKAQHNTSKFQAQREIEGLRERLLCVEDEAKFLKEAMTKRTAELQEARQLCARTAMKLSAAESLVETMSENSIGYSMPSTPQNGVDLLKGDDHLHALHNQGMIMVKPANVNGEDNGWHACPPMLEGDSGILSELVINSSYNINSELDEARCAESWASALFAELSHLSNRHETACIATESLGSSDKAYHYCKPDMETLNASGQELGILSALEKVNQRLSVVRESIITSGLADGHRVQTPNVKGGINGSHSNRLMSDADDDMTHKDGSINDLLEEILQIKGLLWGIERTMAMAGKLESASGSADFSYGHVNDDKAACSGGLFVKQEGQFKASMHRQTSLSRLRFNSLEDGDNKVATLETKFSEQTDKMEVMGIEISEGIDKVGEMGTKFGEESDELSEMGTRFSEKIEDGGITIAEEIGEKADKLADMGAIELSGEVDGILVGADKLTMIRACDKFIVDEDDEANCSGEAGDSTTATAAGRPLANYTKLAAEVVPELESERLLHATLAELELARGRIASLEAELARSLLDKADVANDLSETRAQKQTLEAELARALASVEALKLELSSLPLLPPAANNQGKSYPLQSESPIVADIDEHANMKEEQELAAARAQLADCQRSIHVIRKQMTCEMQQPAYQDVMIYEQEPFDTSSESSKSAEQSSHLPSPKIDSSSHSYFTMPSSDSIIAKPMQDISSKQECKVPSYPLSSNSRAFQKEDEYPKNPTISNVHTTNDMHKSLAPCKDCDDDNKPKPFLNFVRSSSKDHVLKPHQSMSKPHKSSPISRITEFFNRAKPTTRARDM